EPLAREDDLPHRLPAGAFVFEVGAHVHPADFAIRRADDQHDGVSLLLPVTGPARALNLTSPPPHYVAGSACRNPDRTLSPCRREPVPWRSSFGCQKPARRHRTSCPRRNSASAAPNSVLAA